MAKGNWKTNKYIPMIQVRCKEGVYWANPSKPNEYRCTKCGQEGHSRA